MASAGNITGDLADIRAIFESYEDCLATFLAYAVSKTTVLLEFGRTTVDGSSPAREVLPPSQYLLLYGCSHISLPTRWVWTPPVLSTVEHEAPTLFEARFPDVDRCSVFFHFMEIQPLRRAPEIFGGTVPPD